MNEALQALITHIEAMLEIGSIQGDHYVTTAHRAEQVREAMELVKISAEEGEIDAS